MGSGIQGYLGIVWPSGPAGAAVVGMSVASEKGGQGGLVPPHFLERGGRAPRFRAFVMSYTIRRLIQH